MNAVDFFYLVIILFLHFNKKKDRVLGNILTHSQECSSLLENFAVASADFMFCTLQNARPVNICCSCVGAYNAVLEGHDKITKAGPNINSSCDEKLINQDRLEVIESSFFYIKDVWAKGRCKNCFENQKDPFVPSNSTKEFGKLYSDANQCFQNYYNSTTKTYSVGVCHNCSAEYYKMNKFYSNLKETSGNGKVCMDIVDIMNVTQHLWSNVLHCGETVMTVETWLILSSTVFLSLPIAFYLWAWKFTKAESSTVLHQNRLSQRFGERWRNRTGSSISN